MCYMLVRLLICQFSKTKKMRPTKAERMVYYAFSI